MHSSMFGQSQYFVHTPDSHMRDMHWSFTGVGKPLNVVHKVYLCGLQTCQHSSINLYGPLTYSPNKTDRIT